MIETRELYRWIEDWAARRGRGLRLSADDRVAVIETIEALREVARVAQIILKESPPVTNFRDEKWWRGVPEQRFNEMAETVHKLSDWLAEADGG